LTTLPAAKKLPVAGVTVPEPPAEAEVVSRYCVSKFAVKDAVPAAAVMLCEITPPSDQLLKMYLVPPLPWGEVAATV
jgi:hypothetical protein